MSFDPVARFLAPASGLFIKQLDVISQGWLPCLCTLVTTAVLVAEADKLIL
jgi:hypothetical protein